MKLMIDNGDTAKAFVAHFTHWINLHFAQVTHRSVCHLHEGPCGRERPCNRWGLVGEAMCSRKDTFDAYKGSKLAFTRAIAPFPRHTRTQLWAQFLKHNHVGGQYGSLAAIQAPSETATSHVSMAT